MKRKFSIQIHQRKKRKHWDLRVVNPTFTGLWSWAFPKARFPERGERMLAIRTSDHKLSYFDWEGVLDNGDQVKLYEIGMCEIIVNRGNLIGILFKGKKTKGYYVFIKIINKAGDNWIVLKSKKY